MNYFNEINNNVKEYFSILSSNYPTWLDEYINTKEMLRLKYVSMTCGTIYSDLFDSKYSVSTLDHSIGVALIVWNFTHDKKQTLSGLFHDIATPVFKHCVDFFNGDYMIQESTEDLTTYIIENSEEIMKLLNRDNIKVDEVCNYHIYPIADNDTPKLSADRLEYSMSNALFTYNLCTIDEIIKIYSDIFVSKNEDGIEELSFKTKEEAELFVELTSKLSVIYREDKTRYSMQFIADILKRLNNENKITKKDLYILKESDIIDIIKSSKYSRIFDKWRCAKKINVSNIEPKNVYYVNLNTKIRYIDPLLIDKRISSISIKSKNDINNNLSYDMSKYVYLDFNMED